MPSEAAPKPYRIFIAENSHYQDPEHHYEVEGADTAEEAIARCREIVDGSLAEMAQPGRSADEIFADYKLYGDDPFISPRPGERVEFSGWTYAEERASEFEKPNPPHHSDDTLQTAKVV